MKLNKKVELGIKALNALKNRPNPTRTVDIASEVGTTVNFLEQIMRNLRRAGIVTVKRGPGGGYSLDSSKPVTAHAVAQAVGRDLGFPSPDGSSTGRLRNAILDAFYSTVI